MDTFKNLHTWIRLKTIHTLSQLNSIKRKRGETK